MELIHGGDWAGFEARHGQMPLDFSVNVSPLGVPDGVRRAIERAAAGSDRYPDPLCRGLRCGITKKTGMPNIGVSRRATDPPASPKMAPELTDTHR